MESQGKVRGKYVFVEVREQSEKMKKMVPPDVIFSG